MDIILFWDWLWQLPDPQSDFLWGYALLAWGVFCCGWRRWWKGASAGNKALRKSFKKPFRGFFIWGVFIIALILSRFGQLEFLSTPAWLVFFTGLSLIHFTVALFFTGRAYYRRKKSIRRANSDSANVS